MKRYNFYIGNILVTDPEGWDELSIVIEREQDIAGLIVSYTNDLIFYDNGYDILKDRFDSNYNDQIPCLIEELFDGSYTELFNGVIILSDVIFNRDRKTAKATIEDRSFQAAIQANQQIELIINNGFTKNGVQLTAITAYALDFFRTTTGVYFNYTNRKAYLLSDVLDYIIRFISDNKVNGIVSTYLTSATNFNGYLPYLIQGLDLRVGGSQLNVSFKKLFELLQTTHSLAFAFELDADSEPVMRIEHEDFFFQSDTNLSIPNIKDLMESADSAKIYSAVKHGNRTYTTGVYDTVGWINIFKERQYTFKGSGNTDRVLDITYEYITDSNVIQDIVMNASGAYDDDVICVIGNTAGTKAIKNSSPDYFYNLEFTNENNLARFTNGLPNDLIKVLPGATAPALITATPETKSFTSQCNPTVFHDPPLVPPDPDECINLPGASCGADFAPVFNNMDVKTYDLGNNYNTTDKTYTIPVTGEYIINVFVQLEYFTIGAPGQGNVGIAQATLWHLDIGVPFAPLQTSYINYYRDLKTMLFFTPTKQIVTMQISQKISCNINEQLAVSCASAPNTCLPLGDSLNVKLLNASFNIGTSEDYPDLSFNPQNYRARNLEFEKALSLTDFNTLRAAPFGKINIGESELLEETYINRIEHNRETSNTRFKLYR